ncbi:MAG TPA: hypothetical protein VGD43_19635 [Micromonospora sp.]
MTTAATLEHPRIEVTPGDETVCRLDIRNDGSIVESYTVEVVGAPAGWTTAVPATVSVYPGATGTVSLHFRPPRSALVAAGDTPYAVRVVPVEHPDAVVVPEAVVHVLPFADTVAEIVPRTSHGRWGARHEVTIDNRGNTPVRLVVGGIDPDNRLRIAVRPAVLTVGPGRSEFVRRRVRPRKLRGQGHPVTLPFQVLVGPEPEPSVPPAPAVAPVEPVTLDAATVQVPVLPRGLGRLLAALVVLLLVVAGLWYGLLRPAVESAAKEANREQLAPIAQKANEADTKAQSALDRANGAGQSPTPAPSPSRTTAPPAGDVPGVPAGASVFTHRLESTAGNGSTGSDFYATPRRQTLYLTDIIVQNPQGDEGRLEVAVDGTAVFTFTLNNFRDLDYHLVTPIEVPAGQSVSIRVNCQKAGPPLAGAGSAGRCRQFAFLSGYHRRQPSPTPTTARP